VLEKPLQPRSVELAEEVADVRVQHPVHLPAFDPNRERIQRVMRRAPRPESVGETEEVRLVDAVEHLHHGALDDLVLQRGDPQRTQTAVPLGDIRPPDRLRPIAPAVHAPVQIPKVRLEIEPVLAPRDPVHPGCGFRPQPEIG
jgi:hypothetical protein